MTVKADGFRVGYNGYTPKRIPVGSPPYGQQDPWRYVWVDGWNQGRTLAAIHWEIMEGIASQMVDPDDPIEAGYDQ